MTHCPRCGLPVTAPTCPRCGLHLTPAGPPHPGAQPPGQQGPGAPYQRGPSSPYQQGPGPYAPPPAPGGPPRRSKTPLIIGGVAVLLVVAALVGVFVVYPRVGRPGPTAVTRTVVMTRTTQPAPTLPPITTDAPTPTTVDPPAPPAPPPVATTAPAPQTTRAPRTTRATQRGFPAVAVPRGSKECYRSPSGGPYAAAGTYNPTTSCGLAISTREAYLAAGLNGRSGTVRAYSTVNKRYYVMTCSGSQPVRCTGGVRARVIIYGGRLAVGG